MLAVDTQVLASVLNASTARCWSSVDYNPCPGVMENVPSSRGFQGGFAASLMEKDLHLALQVRRVATNLFESNAHIEKGLGACLRTRCWRDVIYGLKEKLFGTWSWSERRRREGWHHFVGLHARPDRIAAERGRLRLPLEHWKLLTPCFRVERWCRTR